MRRDISQYLLGFGIVVLHAAAIALSVVLCEFLGIGSAPLVLVIFVLALVEGWTIISYFRYRAGRQEEVLQLICAAVASKVPLERALRTYIAERYSRVPSYALQGMLVLIVSIVFPFALALWLWVFWRRFDRRVEQFAEHLHEGMPLDEAIDLVPVVLHPEARLAVRVGMATGDLDAALERVGRDPYAMVWLEVVPRLAYPLAVLFAVTGLTTTLFLTFLPRYRKILSELGVEMPSITAAVLDNSEWLAVIGVLVGVAFFATILLAIALAVNSRARWYLPVFGRYYRREQQGRVMRMLALLVDAGLPAPKALHFLAMSDELPAVVQSRITSAAIAIETGEPLSQVLAQRSLIPPGQAPLIDSAETAGTLGWTLRELGEQTSSAAARAVRRLTAIIAPLSIVLVGLVVAFAALATFLPLIRLLEGCA